MSNHTTMAGAVALVTGANRGIGAAFVQGLLDAGARRVYAAARNRQTLATLAQRDSRVIPVALDITDDSSVQAAAAQLIDIDLLVNNAGAELGARLIGALDLSAARQEMEVNYFGLLRMSRAFAPILAANGGGTLINVLSILAPVASPAAGSYSASKASALSVPLEVGQQRWKRQTPAMAAKLTDHVWSIKELLMTVIPPRVVNN